MTRKKKPDQKRGSRKNKSEDSHKERLKATAISLVLLKEGKAVICGKCKRPKRPPNREPTGARWEKWGYCDCGRPTEYKPEYCWMIKQRFEERVVEVYYSEKKNFYSVEDEQVFFDEATGNEHGGIKTYERKPEKTSIQFPTFQRW
ncbi:MAG: hypothetical protein LBG59_09035 [Candidatus Peribacteria bacterium]|jgi:hypothetical protein|nr:hypothetical protein [Candidatus Peribacteria bacterium]